MLGLMICSQLRLVCSLPGCPGLVGRHRKCGTRQRPLPRSSRRACMRGMSHFRSLGFASLRVWHLASLCFLALLPRSRQHWPHETWPNNAPVGCPDGCGAVVGGKLQRLWRDSHEGSWPRHVAQKVWTISSVAELFRACTRSRVPMHSALRCGVCPVLSLRVCACPVF